MVTSCSIQRKPRDTQEALCGQAARTLRAAQEAHRKLNELWTDGPRREAAREAARECERTAAALLRELPSTDVDGTRLARSLQCLAELFHAMTHLVHAGEIGKSYLTSPAGDECDPAWQARQKLLDHGLREALEHAESAGAAWAEALVEGHRHLTPLAGDAPVEGLRDA